MRRKAVSQMAHTGEQADSSATSMLESDPRHNGRPTWIEVDLDRLRGNIRAAQALVGPRTRVMAVVKANAYGHGAAIVSETALDAGADALAVATVDEAVSLRVFGVTAPILVLGPIGPAEIPRAVRNGLSLAGPDVLFVGAVANEVERQAAAPTQIHVKLDTGMHRFGGTPEAALETCRRVSRSSRLRLAGLFTHFADADDQDSRFVERQIGLLQQVAAILEAEGIRPDLVHAANSAGIIRGQCFHLDMVRLGIALYGLPPATASNLPPGFQPVLSVKSTVARILDLAPGDTVSYGRTYTAQKSERAALVPIGYADGLRRDLSNQKVMAMQGIRVPIRGRICMDQTVIGVPEGLPVAPGDIVDVIGTGESGELKFDEAAAALGTLSYELVTALAARLPRYYLQNGIPVAAADIAGVRRLDANG